MAAVAMMVSCSDSEELTQNTLQREQTPENAVKFNTYMGRATRGGAYGSINTTKLADPDYGFGVFAYYTGKTTYDIYRTQNMDPDRYPNFMYNERIVGDGEGGWKYFDVMNTKYWPNELNSIGAVDDQNNDSGNDPATSTNPNGGKVSFFAYAPYTAHSFDSNTKQSGIVGQAVSTADHEGTNAGIIAFSGNIFNGGHADNTPPVNERCKFSDPYLQYRISTTTNKQVDLLWGTTGTNGVNVLGDQQPGVGANTYTDLANNGTPEATRPAYNVNSDMTKQKTNGTVNFLFKHALAKIGGSYVGPGDGSDEDGKTPTNGLMVILDIDKDGKEFGGSLQPYAEGATTTTPYNTKVTVNEVVLQSERQLTQNGKDAIENNTTFNYDAMTESLCNQAIFNLVTGVWHNREAVNPTSRTQTIEQTSIDQSDPTGSTKDADVTKDAVLNHNIAEPRTASPANWTNSYTKEAFEALPVGVTTVAKNVYENDAQPFVFIPGTYPVITITIDYTVRTYDAKLAKKYSEVRQKITKRLYILDEIELNKQYNILMHLGLTSVKFTASVSDWEVTNATGTTIDPGNGTSPVTTFDEEMEHVYLPINVAGIAKATINGTAYDVPADNTITLAQQSKDPATLELDVITFTRSDGTTLATNNTNDITFTAAATGIAGATASFGTDGKLTVYIPENASPSVSRAATVTVTGTSSAGVNMATLNIVIPQEGTHANTPAAALAYTYPTATPYTYKGTFAVVDANTMTYDIDITNIGSNGINVRDDFARMLGALYRAGGVTSITFDGKDYAWDETLGNKGSNWTNDTTTLVAELVNKFQGMLGAGKSKVTFITDRGNITFDIHIKSSAELAAEYNYSPPYTYNGSFTFNANNVTYNITAANATANGGKNIMNDMARFLGGLYRNGGVTAINYKGTDYTWNDALTMTGSRWYDGTTTLVAVLADEFRFGVPDGTQLTLTTNMGDIVFTVNIQ